MLDGEVEVGDELLDRRATGIRPEYDHAGPPQTAATLQDAVRVGQRSAPLQVDGHIAVPAKIVATRPATGCRNPRPCQPGYSRSARSGRAVSAAARNRRASPETSSVRSARMSDHCGGSVTTIDINTRH